MMNPPSRPSVLATLMMGLYLIPTVHIQAQIVTDVPTVASFTELQQVLDAAWVDRTTSALYPPGLTYTNSLPLIAVEAGFDSAFLSALQAGATPGGIALRKGIVREDLAGRLWFGAAASPVATTTFPVGYAPDQWVLATFPPPAGTTGAALDDYIADRRLTRQAMAFSLIAVADIPAYEAELQARFAAAAAVAANLGEEDIGMIQVELTPPSGPMEILVRAPFWVDYLGVYETRDLMNPFPWTPLGTVPHTFDPMAWSYPLPGDLRYVILANHMVDNDGDGILDAIERLVLGTDPDNWDSDGDGVGDYAEVFIFESNPLLGGAGGVGDQIRLGLGIENPDMTKVVSGPVELRHKTWRAERSKVGFPGFKVAGTYFGTFHSELTIDFLDDPTRSTKATYDGGPWKWDFESNEGLTVLEGVGKNPFKQTVIEKWPLPAMVGTHSGWISGSDIYPYSGSATPTGNNSTFQQQELTETFNLLNTGRLDKEYTDSMLRWKTLLDVLSVRMMSAPLDWEAGRRLIRPMPWVTDSGTGQSSFDPNPQDVSAGSRAERHADTVGAPPVLTGLKLQQMAFQATSLDQTFPADHLLRTVLLEVHRSQPDNPAEEGAVTKVVPKPVYLKHGTPAWESMVFEMPPPVENSTVEMVDGYVDLSITGLEEAKEEYPGIFVPYPKSISFSLSGLDECLALATYYLEVKGPPGANFFLFTAGTLTSHPLPLLLTDQLGTQEFTLATTQPGTFEITVTVRQPGTPNETKIEVDRIIVHNWQVILEPITCLATPDEFVNPCGIIIGKQATYHITVLPASIPNGNITWTCGSGNVSFVDGQNHGRTINVTGISHGDFSLSVDVAGVVIPTPLIEGRVVYELFYDIHAYIVRSDDGSIAAADEDTVRDAIMEVNRLYRQTGYKFNISIAYTNKTEWLDITPDGEGRNEAMQLTSIENADGAIEVYFVDSINGRGGFSFNAGKDNAASGIVIRKADKPGQTIAHEIGHAFGLEDLYDHYIDASGAFVDPFENVELSKLQMEYDWGSNGAESYYSPDLHLGDVLGNLLMNGKGGPPFSVDIPFGKVFGRDKAGSHKPLRVGLKDLSSIPEH